MALLFMDGFDQYANYADMLTDARWASSEDGTGNYVTTGRDGIGKAINFESSYTTPQIVNIYTDDTTLIYGAAVYIEAYNVGSGTVKFLDKTGLTFLYFEQDIQGDWRVRNGDDELLATFTTGVAVWAYIEVKALFHDTTGTLQVRVNEQLVVDLTGLDTAEDNCVAPFIPRQVQWESTNYTHATFWDDLYICDTLSADNNDFLGDVTIRTMLPDGDSAVEWTKSAGATNWENLDTFDGDTTYNHSVTATEKDLITFEDMPIVPGSVIAVGVSAYMRKETIGYRGVQLHLNSGANLHEGPIEAALTMTYSHLFHFEAFEVGTTPWTETTVNALIAGYEVL
jgi:hypothetical protein